MSNDSDTTKLQSVLDEAISQARANRQGSVANYIPELASVPEDLTAIAVSLKDGTCLSAGDSDQKFTLQSASKLIALIGMLEERGIEEVMQWCKLEPSGDDFASIARLDQFGPKPSNPMLNSGAISLTAHIPGNAEEKLAWLESWVEKLYGLPLTMNLKIYASERRTGDRNRSLAYLLKSRNMLADDVDSVLDTYFAMCSYEATAAQAAYLPMLLANHGVDPAGKRVFFC